MKSLGTEIALFFCIVTILAVEFTWPGLRKRHHYGFDEMLGTIVAGVLLIVILLRLKQG